MRRRYIQDPQTGELVPAEQYQRERPDGPMICDDITPYRSMVTGELITSRSKHREHLRRHEMQEVGDNMPRFLRDKYEREGVRPVWGRDGRRIR